MAAVLEDAGHEVHVLDLCFSENCAKDISRVVNEICPDVIGITIRNIDNCSGSNMRFLLQEVNNDVIAPCKKSFSGPLWIIRGN